MISNDLRSKTLSTPCVPLSDCPFSAGLDDLRLDIAFSGSRRILWDTYASAF